MAIIKVTNSKATLNKAINYITKEEKVNGRLVSGINCTPETALMEMEATKELYNKTEGRQYYHYVQSFSPDENITHDKAHELAREFAEENFKGYEVLIATHKDREHIHSHFVVNSVSFETGAKYQSSKKDLENLKSASNRLCEREGLNVIKSGERDNENLTSYNQKKYRVLEKAVQGTEKSYLVTTYNDVKSALSKATSKDEFINLMEQKGYGVTWTETRKNITFTTPEGKKVRNSNLVKTFKNDRLTKEGMEIEISRNRELGREGNSRGNDSSKSGINRNDVARAIIFGRGAEKVHNFRNDKPVGADEKDDKSIRGREKEINGGIEEVRGKEGTVSRESEQGHTWTSRGNQSYEGTELQEDRGSSEQRGTISYESKGDYKNDKFINFSSGENRQAGLEEQSETVFSSNGNNSRNDIGDNRSISSDDLLGKIASGFKIAEKMTEPNPDQQEQKTRVSKTKNKAKNKAKNKHREDEWER